MKKMIFAGVVILGATVTVVSFFMPWATVATSATRVSKELTTAAGGPLKDTPFAGKFIKQLDRATTAISEVGDIEIKASVSGYQVPKMVNDRTSKVALSLAQIFFKSTEGLDKKSYLVYLLPLSGIICGALAVLGLKNKLYVIIMAVLGGAISIGGLYNLYTVDLSSAVVDISIQKGLWFTMYAFLLIFLVGVAWLVLEKKKA
jgi:hypothetical protein